MNDKQFIHPNDDIKFPTDIAIDLAITVIKLRDKFNVDDGQLGEYDLDWWYYHKLARRAKYWLDKLGIEVPSLEE